ncbi:MAG: VTT domain-containing protein [Chromatiaceae bacterium]
MTKLVAVVRSAFFVSSLVVLGALISEYAFQQGPETIKQWADAEIRGTGATGILLFLTVGAAFTGIGLPRQVFAVAAGYVYGIAAGTALALSAEMLGVLMGFLYARFFARDLVIRRYPARIRKIDDCLRAYPFSMTLAVRLFPVGNNLVVNLLAGVSNMRLMPFMAASAVGHFPQTLVFAMMGGGFAESDLVQGTLALVLFGISAGLGAHLYGRYRRGRAFFDDSEGCGAAPAAELAQPRS